MILVLLGTKAQLIKMAPVIREMSNNGLAYRFLWTDQHAETIEALLETFELSQPIHLLNGDPQEASTPKKLLIWAFQAWRALSKKNHLLHDVDTILVHGDTASTLFGALVAKRWNLALGHVEAGLRSGNLFDPFPEEAIRRFVSRIADVHYCQNYWSAHNLRNIRKNSKIINTDGNTLLDSVRIALDPNNTKRVAPSDSPYGVVSIHRFENIGPTKRLASIVKILCEVANTIKLIFVMHPATNERLRNTQLLEKLKAHNNILLSKRMNYPHFIALLNDSNFLISDGGSNQEETSYLGIPCLLLRNNSERIEGLGENTVLSRFNPDTIKSFVEKYANKTLRNERTYIESSPSAIIVKDLQQRYSPTSGGHQSF